MSDQPPPPPPPPASDGSASGSGAAPGLGVRFGARLIDAFVVGIPLGIIFAGNGVNTFESLVTSAVGFAYLVWFEANRSGQTIGKQLLNLRVVAEGGGAETMDQAVRRNAWVLVGIVPIVGGLLSLLAVIWIVIGINSDPGNVGPHDKMAGARVVPA